VNQPGPVIIVTRKLTDSVEATLSSLFNAEINSAGMPFDRQRLAEAMGRCDILASTVSDQIDAELIGGAGERLRLIANFGVGTDNIDLAAARARGIAVTNTPDVLTEDTADLTMALILMSLRGLGEGERTVRAGQWGGWRPTDQLGRSLGGKALGIVGMGRIGEAVARRARAFQMVIHYHNRRPATQAVERELDAHFHPDLDEMLSEVDVLSLNCPYGPDTHHLIDRRRLSLMRGESWLVNAARGAIVDQEALIEALETGTIAGAGLDVYPKEPEVDPRLRKLTNVVLLPHLGSATVETRTAMGEKVLANILAFTEGRDLPDRVA
jgi:glyoxylate reductase